MSTGERREGRGAHVGTLFLATVLGVGVGLLAAPQAGVDTRRTLRRRIAAIGDDFDDELDELRERGGKAQRAIRERAAELRRRARKRYEETADELEDEAEELDEDAEEDEGSSVLPTALTLAVGVAAAYLLTSDRAATARERVREAAATVRDEAEARWDRFQSRRSQPANAAPPSS